MMYICVQQLMAAKEKPGGGGGPGSSDSSKVDRVAEVERALYFTLMNSA